MILPQVVSGAALVSVVMDLPTNGPLLLRSLQSQDMYLAGAFLMFEATLVVIGVFISDILLAMLDPRIRLGGASSKRPTATSGPASRCPTTSTKRPSTLTAPTR